ncbi:unnamed protein product, partial [Didymodactylos carnosus]
MTKILMTDESSNVVISLSKTKRQLYVAFGLILLLSIAALALTASTLGVVINRLNLINNTTKDQPSSITSTTTEQSPSLTSTTTDQLSSLVDTIKIDQLITHLQQLQVIADQSNGTRAIATQGFNSTLDYITLILQQQTNYIIQHQYFTVRNYILERDPTLISSIDGTQVTYTYLVDFTYILFSSAANFSSFVPLIAVPNLGCNDSDWMGVTVLGRVALVKRGDCTFIEKSSLAQKYQVAGLLIYNDGTAPDRFQPMTGIRNNLNTTIPALFLSYQLGMLLVEAATNTSADIIMNIDVKDANGIGNICADTPTGDKTKTIVIGSHSDGVPAGSGINDNVGNLVLAINLARLLTSSSKRYDPYPYRVRFCWWGAEEIGLIGSIYHVDQALLSTTTTEGERFQDYLLNLNYDMLGSPNYRFGIHDGTQAPPGTPEEAINGSIRISELYREWFNKQKLPWSNSSLGGGSDYVPFLAAGLVVGGIAAGAGGIKPMAERDRYDQLLGQGLGGLANAAFDTCYHQQCDRIQNINTFAYENIVKAAAYVLEYLGRLNDLENWLYPQGRSKYVVQNYNSLYEFDG